MVLKNCNYSTFLNKIKNKKIVCFGTGKMLLEMETEFINSDFSSQQIILTDNDSRKWHTNKLIFGKKIEILPPREILSNINKEYIIVITTEAYTEIIKQLDNLVDDTVDCYIYPFLRRIELDRKSLDVLKLDSSNKKKTMYIPKIIHYCWFGDLEMNLLQKKCIESWVRNCPDYKIICWSEKNYDVSKNKYMFNAYKEKKWAFVSDYARLDIIYQYGGIYLDADVELVKNIDNLLYDKAYAGFENIDNVNFGSGFGAEPGFFLLREIMKEYENINFCDKMGNLDLTASPIYQTKVLERFGLQKNGNIQYVEGMKIYPFEYLCAQSLYTGIIYETENTYSIHRFASSWQDENYVKDRKNKLELLRKLSGYNY